MSAEIIIGGVDRSDKIIPESVTLQRAITNQVDTLAFNVVRKGGAVSGGYKPELVDTVLLKQDGTTIFGGQIVQIDETVDGADVESFIVQCKDFSFDMDRFLVVGTFENMSVEDIIDSINTSFLPAGYDLTNVVAPTIISYASFNYEYPTKVFQQLADLTNSDWYVNENKEIFFFEKETLPAPFDLTDDNENFYYNSLKIKNDVKSLRNSIIVRGGKYVGNATSEERIADGTQTTFLQMYQYTNVFVKVNTVSQTIGIDFIDDPGTVDVLYNFQEKAVKFPDGSQPALDDVVEVGGNPYIPVIVQVKNAASILEFGEFQFKIVDPSINSKQGAIERGRAELTMWANEISDGTFETKQPGLQVGQVINVSSVIRDLDKDYIISRIQTKLTNGKEFLHMVTLMTTQTFGMIEFLQKLLIQKDRKDLEINPDELLESIVSMADSFTFTDAVTAATNTTGPYVYGTAIMGFSTVSA